MMEERMNDSAKIKYFPKYNMKAYDGMSVTADVWDMAHTEHRDMMRAHFLSMHKPGIICGLEIRANDPADHYVFISPGAAIDELGRVIVVDQTIAYDFGDEGAGTYLLLIGYAEREKEDPETKIKVFQHEYIIAARQSLPKQPVVELARLTISRKGAVIHDAVDPFQPGKDELDLRYRYAKNSIGDRIRVAAICYPEDNPRIYKGWRVLASELEQMLQLNMIVDMFQTIDERINDYDMIYIAADGSFTPTDVQLALLKNYYNNGRGILMEALNSEGGKTLKGIAESFDAKPVDPDVCRFYQMPFYFRFPPEQISENRLMYAKRLVLCMDPLVEPWSGDLKDESLSRSEIRTNLEWGANLVSYCAR